MKPETRAALNALNRRFYERRGAEFDATRDHPWPGWDRAISHIAPRGNTDPPLRVLDVGCGNARFARFLIRSRPDPIDYHGIDASKLLLDRARSQLGSTPRTLFARLDEVDFIDENDEAAATIAPGPFDLIVLFGVLHHVPGHETRARLLTSLAERVADGGTLVVTAWQFGDHARFDRTTIDCDAVAARARALGFDPDDFEPGDHLLGFGGDAETPRYCHLTHEAELDALVADLDLVEVDRYRDDGKTHDLNAYRVLQRDIEHAVSPSEEPPH